MARRQAAAKRKEPAVVARSGGPGLRQRLSVWRDLHAFSLVSSLGRLAARPFATGLTVAVMGIALALPLALGLLLGEAERLAGQWRESREISLYLRVEVAEQEAQAMAASLADDGEVASIVLRSPQQGMDDLAGDRDLAAMFAALERNPLPLVLVVEPTPGVDPEDLAARLGGLPAVELAQYDAAWRARLNALLGLGRRAAALAAILLGLGALLVVGNTVRLDIQARAEEIATVQLLGGSDGFVRRPFLYLGVWYGLLAGGLALVLAAGATMALQGPVAALASTYGSDYRLAGLAVTETFGVLGAALALGWLGAFLAVGQHLRRHRRAN
jgi:cell division transport system permease protein